MRGLRSSKIVFLLLIESYFSGSHKIEEVLRIISVDTLFLYGSGFDDWTIPAKTPRIITNESVSQELRNTFNKNIASVINLENLEMLETLSEYLEENMYSKVLIAKKSKMDDAEIFKRCFEVGLLNVVIFDSSQELTTYLPFAANQEPQSVNLSNVFTNDFKNFHGLRIKLGGTIFQYLKPLANAASAFQKASSAFENKYNIKLVYPYEDPDVFIYLRYKKEILEAGQISSFFEYENLDIVIPIKNSIDRYLYLVQPFNWKVWVAVIVGLIYNSVVLNISVKYFVKDHDFPTSLLECLQMTLWQSVNIKKHHWILSSIYVVLLIEGFLLVNLYSMYLGSFLVVDIKAQDFEIAIITKADVIQTEFNDVSMFKFKHMSIFEYAANLLVLNMDYGYVVNKRAWETNSALRENFKIVKKEIRKPMPRMAVFKKDFRLKDLVNHFFLMEYSHGIVNKWIKEFIELKPSEALKPSAFLVLNDFKIVVNLFYYGMGFATVIFIGELVFVNTFKKFNLLRFLFFLSN